MKTIFPLLLLAPVAQAAVSIDYALVGDIGNMADASGYGSVAYAYQISKNETTIGQYVEFLNAVAKADINGLYHPSMASNGNIAGIIRSGSFGSYSYSAAYLSGNRPITYVNWYDAARFCNWLHNGQQTGAGAALTAETGAYTLNGATSGIISKNLGATIWIPTENEWYKAAYYDPTKGGAGGYWLHANQSDTMTSNSIGTAGAANYYANDFATTQHPTQFSTQNYLTNVGAYGANSDSYYGTNDQAGNVGEWNDAIISGSSRGLRGGAWNNYAASLRSSYSEFDNPAYESSFVGFRVASVPEPTSVVLTVLFGMGIALRRRR